jgi:hypothetical protein
MKLSGLITRAQAALDMWGDIECFMDTDNNDSIIFCVGDLCGELINDKVDHVLITSYETRAKLSVVK